MYRRTAARGMAFKLWLLYGILASLAILSSADDATSTIADSSGNSSSSETHDTSSSLTHVTADASSSINVTTDVLTSHEASGDDIDTGSGSILSRSVSTSTIPTTGLTDLDDISTYTIINNNDTSDTSESDSSSDSAAAEPSTSSDSATYESDLSSASLTTTTTDSTRTASLTTPREQTSFRSSLITPEAEIDTHDQENISGQVNGSTIDARDIHEPVTYSSVSTSQTVGYAQTNSSSSSSTGNQETTPSPAATENDPVTPVPGTSAGETNTNSQEAGEVTVVTRVSKEDSSIPSSSTDTYATTSYTEDISTDGQDVSSSSESSVSDIAEDLTSSPAEISDINSTTERDTVTEPTNHTASSNETASPGTSAGSSAPSTAQSREGDERCSVSFYNQVLGLVIAAMIIHVLFCAVTSFCVYKIVRNHHFYSWDPPPVRYGSVDYGMSVGKSNRGLDLSPETLDGIPLPPRQTGGRPTGNPHSKHQRTSGNPLYERSGAASIPIMITNEDGWCVPYSDGVAADQLQEKIDKRGNDDATTTVQLELDRRNSLQRGSRKSNNDAAAMTTENENLVKNNTKNTASRD